MNKWTCFTLELILCLASSWTLQVSNVSVESELNLTEHNLSFTPKNKTNRPSGSNVEIHFCLFDPSGNNQSLTGLFRMNHFLYTRFEYDLPSKDQLKPTSLEDNSTEVTSKQSLRGCLYHIFELKRQRFIHHSVKCSDILGNETFSRIVGSISDQSGYINRIIGYGKVDQDTFEPDLLYRDFNVRHKVDKNQMETETLEYDKLTAPKKFIVMNIGEESLITLLESHFDGERRFIALTKLNDPIRHRSFQHLDEPMDPIVQYRAVIVGQSYKEHPTETMGSIIAGYQSLGENSWVHLLDEQNNVLTISMQLIEQAFNVCGDCKVIQLDYQSLVFDQNSSLLPIKEHLKCENHIVDPNHHHWEENASQLLFIEKNFWGSFRDVSIGMALFFAFFLIIIATVSVFRTCKNNANA